MSVATKEPSVAVGILRTSACVRVSMICTSASATLEPVESTTWPLIAPVAPPCAKARPANNKAERKTKDTTARNRKRINSPSDCWTALFQRRYETHPIQQLTCGHIAGHNARASSRAPPYNETSDSIPVCQETKHAKVRACRTQRTRKPEFLASG